MAFPWMVNFFNPPRDQLRLVFTSAVSNTTRFDLTNNTAIDLVVAEIYMDWPASNDALFNHLKGGTVIWSGADVDPPTLVNGGWLNGIPARTFYAKTTDRIEQSWGVSAQASGYEMRVTFTNGWSITVVN